MLVRKNNSPDLLRSSGTDGWFNILLDDSDKPDATLTPIWLGNCTIQDATSRAQQSPKTLGIVRRVQRIQDQERITFAIRALTGEVVQLRPLITLQKRLQIGYHPAANG